jgi:hypothetical protein
MRLQSCKSCGKNVARAAIVLAVLETPLRGREFSFDRVLELGPGPGASRRYATSPIDITGGDLALTRDAAPAAAIHRALEPLAAALAPHRRVVECGGGGTCGPNSLARVLAYARLHEGDGDDVRRRVVAHATKLLHARAVWEPASGSIDEILVRDVIEDSFATWAIPGQSVNRVGGGFDWGVLDWHESIGSRQLMTAERWLKHMADPSAWIDQAFLALAADCFGVEVAYYVVSGEGAIGHTRVMDPRPFTIVKARVELAYVVDQHFCAVIPREIDAGGR